jgi:AraC family transcriptional activator of pyochelin receptor
MGMNTRRSRLRISFLDLFEWSRETNPENAPHVGHLGRFYASVQHERLRGTIEKYCLKPGLKMSFSDLWVDQDTELVIQLDEPTVGFGLIVEASGTRAITDGRGSVAEVEMSPRLNLISVIQGREWLLRIAGGRRHRAFRVQVEKRLLPELIQGCGKTVAKSLAHIMSPSSSPKAFVQKKLSPTGEYLAHQVLQCSLEGVTRRLFMESKALETLAYELEEFSDQAPGKAIRRDLQEMEGLYHARRILEAEFTNPPSLFQLSRRVGLNDFKLKRGFREEFRNSVFGYVRQLRMEKARSLLEGSDLSVTQVALEAGYNSFGHFAAAFKRSFGILPSQYRRTRPKPPVSAFPRDE